MRCAHAIPCERDVGPEHAPLEREAGGAKRVAERTMELAQRWRDTVRRKPRDSVRRSADAIEHDLERSDRLGGPLAYHGQRLEVGFRDLPDESDRNVQVLLARCAALAVMRDLLSQSVKGRTRGTPGPQREEDAMLLGGGSKSGHAATLAHATRANNVGPAHGRHIMQESRSCTSSPPHADRRPDSNPHAP
jgi:hypothetical protein